MTVEELFFYLIAAITVLGGLGVVLLRNVVHAALGLMLALVGVAGLFILLSAEFLGLVQVLIYGGAVTILILFALMLTRTRDMPQAMIGGQWPLGLLAAATLLGVIIAAVATADWLAPDQPTVIPFQSLGDSLFRTWAVPFEVASLVLLVALVGAIILARREEGE